MNTHDYKIKLFEAIKARPVYTQQVSSIEIRTRCPWCGDSKTNSTKARLYIHINPNDNSPVLYHCFNCPAQGVLEKEDLEVLGITDSDLVNNFGEFSKSVDHISSRAKIASEKYFQYKLPPCKDRRKIDYIEKRIGRSFTDKELQDLKVISSFKDFLIHNGITTVTCKPGMARMVEEDYVGFLSSNNAFILFRDITEKNNIRWYKYRITEESEGQRLFYSIRNEVNLYDENVITVNLSEGVFDAIGIHNYNMQNPSHVNIAICGHFYGNMVKYLISTGLVGKNIIYNIYADRDYTKETSPEFLQKSLSKYVPFTKEINLFYNTIEKDCGVPKDRIILRKYTV